MQKENIIFDIIVQIYAACDFILIIITVINSFVKYMQTTLIHLFRNNRVTHRNLSIWTYRRFNLRHFNNWIFIWLSQQVPMFTTASFKFEWKDNEFIWKKIQNRVPTFSFFRFSLVSQSHCNYYYECVYKTWWIWNLNIKFNTISIKITFECAKWHTIGPHW